MCNPYGGVFRGGFMSFSYATEIVSFVSCDSFFFSSALGFFCSWVAAVDFGSAVYMFYVNWIRNSFGVKRC